MSEKGARVEIEKFAKVVEMKDGAYSVQIGKTSIEPTYYFNVFKRCEAINAALENHPEIKRLREIERAAEALANGYREAKGQWGDDYFWKKWRLNQPIEAYESARRQGATEAPQK